MSHQRTVSGQRLRVLLLVVGSLVAAGGVLTVLGLAIWVLPPTLVGAQLPTNATITDADRLKAINDIRGALLTALGVLAVLSGTVVAYLNFRGTIELQRRGQVTDRFGKAVDQLGRSELDVRIGGIYALEQIARDAQDLRRPIVEVLVAFLRERAKRPQGGGIPNPAVGNQRIGLAAKVRAPQDRVAPDVQAALTVLGRRKVIPEPILLNLSNLYLPHLLLEKDGNLQGANLFETELQGSTLEGVNFEGADLRAANLENAIVRGANLRNADLRWAKLEHTNLTSADLRKANLAHAEGRKVGLERANLEGAELTEADFEGAYLSGANFRGAHLRGAHFEGADLRGADFEGAVLIAYLQNAKLAEANVRRTIFGPPDAEGVTWEQVRQARNVTEARLPSYIAFPPSGPATESAEVP